MTLYGHQDNGGAPSVSAPTYATSPPPPQRSASFANVATQNGTMSSTFHPNPQPIRPPGAGVGAFPLPIGTAPSKNGFSRDPSSGASHSFTAMSSAATSPKHSVLVRRLSLDTTEDVLRVMLVFSQELTSIDLLSPDVSEDVGYRSAIISFESPNGAIEAKMNLNGKMNFKKDSTMIVDIMNGGFRRSTVDLSSNATPASSVSSSRGSGRIPMPFPPFDGAGPPSAGGFFSTINSASLANVSDLVNSEPVGPANHYHQMFSAQSPIGNHRARPTTRELLEDDTVFESDTLNMLPSPYGDSSSLTAAIRAAGLTGPAQVNLPPPNQQNQQIQMALAQHFSGLTLNTSDAINDSANGPMNGHMNGSMNGPLNGSMSGPMNGPMNGSMNGSMSGSMSGSMNSSMYSSLNGTPLSKQPMSLSPMEPNGIASPYAAAAGFRPPKMPSINLADQHPPCNTLYVGNLPASASEEELKAMFSRQRGYKRMCFRTKPNGPMCFVEFESITTATKALLDLYGRPLHNSVKGGIRLSFSKNPLGVRNHQNPNSVVPSRTPVAHMSNPGSFVPPPGLSAPPGLGNGHMVHGNGMGSSYHGSQPAMASIHHQSFTDHPGNNGGGWANAPHYQGSFNGNHAGTNSLTTGPSAATAQPFMMGR